MTRITDLTTRILAVERERDQLREVNCRLRDKLLEFAKDCEPCHGTGVITVDDEHAPAFGRTLPCYACEDIRELLA
jgi:hypothetical protein